jgi:methylmalonyl-CoA mutase
MKFDEFEDLSSKAWKQRIQFELNGDDFNSNLVWKSLEGVDVKPFYHYDSGIATHPIKHQSDAWKIGEQVYVQNAKSANILAKECLNKGAESIYFILPKSSIDIQKLLDGIDVSTIRVYLDLQFLDPKFTTQIEALNINQNSKLFILSDCIGHLAKSGNWHKNLVSDKKNTIDYCNAMTGVKSVISIDMAHYQNAGASMVQQLAYALAHAHEYIVDNERFNISNMIFKVAIGGNYFFEIAKLQALRWLWQTLMEEYGKNIKCHIISEPSKRNKTIYDYNINMLRSTTEVMSAALGGSNTIINLPYDALYHKDNEFGRRLSRNQLLILKHESKFSEVNNPTEGTYYIKHLTKQLAEKALKLFKDIEKEGGFLELLKSGIIQRKIKEHAQKEQESFNVKEQELVGIHVQQNRDEKMKSQLELYPFLKYNPRKTLLEPILARRIAESLEQKRLDNE